MYILKIALNLFVTSWANVSKKKNLKNQFVVQVELNKKRGINFMGNEKLSTNGNGAYNACKFKRMEQAIFDTTKNSTWWFFYKYNPSSYEF